MVKSVHLTNLFELLAIPSISAQSKHKGDIHKACVWLSKKLTDLEFKTSILPTAGHSVVYAEKITNKSYPTILIYGHYDVQSPDPLSEWKSDPFVPEIKDGNIYARGVADDKGQLYTWLAALSELKAKNQWPKANIKFLIEGEEEVGSVNLDAFIAENITLLKADVCVMSDTHCLSTSQPLIDVALKGLVYCEIKLRSLAKDAHSGLYGGNVLNPANALAQIIAKLKDENHKVLIPGFYDNVITLSKTDKKEIARYPFGEKEVKKETGSFGIVGEKGFTVAERAGARPTLDVNGMWSGYTGEGPKTIIPAEANAKISMRLVPNQTTAEIVKKFEKYVNKIAPKEARVAVKILSTGEPILIDTNSKYFAYAVDAYEKVFGKKPIFERSGGSIPVTATFKTLLGIDSILMGYGLPDDGLHSPNEKLAIEMFKKGIKTNIEFLKQLA